MSAAASSAAVSAHVRGDLARQSRPRGSRRHRAPRCAVSVRAMSGFFNVSPTAMRPPSGLRRFSASPAGREELGMRRPAFGRHLAPIGRHVRTHHEAVFGVTDRRLDQVVELSRSEAPQRRRRARATSSAWRSRRSRARSRDPAGRSRSRPRPRRRACRPTCRAVAAIGDPRVEIEASHAAAGRVIDMHAAEPGDAAHLRVDSRLNQRGRHGRVDRVAARRKHLRPRLDRLRLCRNHHSALHRCRLSCRR